MKLEIHKCEALSIVLLLRVLDTVTTLFLNSLPKLSAPAEIKVFRTVRLSVPYSATKCSVQGD